MILASINMATDRIAWIYYIGMGIVMIACLAMAFRIFQEFHKKGKFSLPFSIFFGVMAVVIAFMIYDGGTDRYNKAKEFDETAIAAARQFDGRVEYVSTSDKIVTIKVVTDDCVAKADLEYTKVFGEISFWLRIENVSYQIDNVDHLASLVCDN